MSFQTLAEIDFVARPTVQKGLKGLPGLAVVKFSGIDNEPERGT